MNQITYPMESQRRIDERYMERHSSQYHRSREGNRRRRDASNNADAFGDFPPQMMMTQQQHASQATTTTSDTTPQTTNRRADVQFAEDSRFSEMRSNNNVLVLGGGSNHSRQSPFVNATTTTPNNAATKFHESSLDYSMITTPGAGGILESSDNIIIHTTSSLPASTGRSWAAAGTPFSNILRGVVSSTPCTEVSTTTTTPYTAARELLNYQQPQSTTPVVESDTTLSTTQQNNNMESTALAFAKSAPLSGYLRKLGRNIPTFKRRFFVLKPSTHLYYFISPHDVEPRGCIDLDMVWRNNDDDGREGSGGGGGCEVREIGSFPDGTFRFELLYDEETESPEDSDRGNNNVLYDDNESDAASRSSQLSSRRRSNFQRQSIVLEARTEEMGREWMAKLQSERLSTARGELNSIRKNMEEMKSNILRWESSAYEEALRAEEAERQRNTAISEARRWEEKFVNLNEAIRLLAKSSSNHQRKPVGGSSEFFTETLEAVDVNGTNFDELSNAFHTIHNDYNELSKREEDAVNERIAELEQRAKDAESRAIKAEKDLSDLVEENQAMQLELKKTKREKKILVKEVRSLHASAKSMAEQNALSDAMTDQKQQQHDPRSSASSIARPNNRMNNEERRLVIELEEHVMSGLRLSDQFLTLNGIDPSEILDDLDNSVQASSIHDGKATTLDKSPQRLMIQQKSEDVLLDLSPIPGNRAVGIDTYQRSLLDEKDDESEDDAAVVSTDTKSAPPSDLDKPSNHSNNYDGGDDMNYLGDSNRRPDLHNHAFQYEYASPGSDIPHQNLNARFIDTTRQREDARTYQPSQSTIPSHEETVDRALPSLDMASSASESSRSRVTDNGLATTKLECPLKDVEETRHRAIGDDGNVYHITFYGNKIGLQFQKVPNESKSGLLTEAMTADHGPNVGGANQTAAELKRIASISQQTLAQRNNKGNLSSVCLPATPTDAVLVCGVVGFDESCGNIPPRIGGELETMLHSHHCRWILWARSRRF